MQLRRILLMSAFTAAGLPLLGQTTNLAHPTPIAATAPTAVPALVPYNAIAAGNDGKALSGEVSMTFLLFKDETGGEPLWTESQRVSVDSLGHYGVQLGSSSPSGMPLTVFASGEARWLEVQVAGQKQQARVMLSSVPYAAKAADSATLGGLPASAFMLAATAEAIAASSPSSITSNTTSNVTTTGGTTHYLPKFSGASTVINSQIYDTGTSVGIGDIPNASVKLDVGGGMIMRGPMIVSRTDNATASQAFPSFGFAFYSNVYDSGTHATDNPHYLLQSEPAGNNTSNTSATFNLLYSNHGSTPAETGFYVNTNGTVHFASGQTFPGTGDGDITSVTAGTGLSGGGTSGAVTLSNAGILALTANSGVKSSGGQSPTLTIDTTKIPTLTDAPTFSSSSSTALSGEGSSGETGVYGFSDTGHAGYFVSEGSGASTTFSVSEPSSGTGGYAFYGISTGTDGYGLYSEAEGNGSYGVYGYAPGGADTSGTYAVGVYGVAVDAYAVRGDAGDGGIGVTGFGTTGYGVYGSATTGYGVIGSATTGYAGVFDSAGPTTVSVSNSGSDGIGVNAYSDSGIAVFGAGDGESNIASAFIGDGILGGVWGDTGTTYNNFGDTGGLVGTADDNFAAYLVNNSSNYSTLGIETQGSGGSGLFKSLQATSREGTCGIGGGNLTCTGQVKSLASTNGGANKVETYAMQSPENWMEDFGSGSLKNGVATVSIDPAFAETANTATDYFVFLTPRGDSKGLYVVAQTGTTFEVHESGGGASSLGFAYRIVAKRRGYETQRLTDVTEKFTAETAVSRAHFQLLQSPHAKVAKKQPPVSAALRNFHPGRGLQKQQLLRRPIAAAVPQRHTGN